MTEAYITSVSVDVLMRQPPSLPMAYITSVSADVLMRQSELEAPGVSMMVPANFAGSVMVWVPDDTVSYKINY